MSNLNTISAFVGGTGRNQMPAISGDLSTATAAVIATDTTGTTATAVLGIPLQTAILGASNARAGNAAILGNANFNGGVPRGRTRPFFSSDDFEGVPFRVRVHGTATMGANAAQSLLISLTLGTSSTIGSNVVVGTTGAALATVAGGACTFSIVAELIWSSAIGNVAGRHSATISFVTPTRQVVSDVINTNATTAAAAATNLKFVVFATACNAASSSVQFKEFALELV
jgi:hypothetical protein